MKNLSENRRVRDKAFFSLLAYIMALLFLIAAVLSAISLIGLLRPGMSDYVRSAIASHGIYGRETITSYLFLHIAARVVLFLLSAVFSFGILGTLANKKPVQGSVRSGMGISAMIFACNAVHKLVKPIGIALGALFAFKMIRYLCLCFEKRYLNAMIFSFFATIFGELLLALIALGVMRWISRFSSSLEDDLTSIEYLLITQKASAYGISSVTFYSLIASAAASIAVSFAVSYDGFAFAAFIAGAIAEIIGAVFMRNLKKFSEEQAYEEYLNNGGISGGKPDVANISYE